MTNFFGVSPVTVAAWMTVGVGVILLGLLVLAAFNRMLLRIALRNTVRRPAQTVLIVFGLMLATVIFTATLAVGDTLTYSLQASQVRQIGGIDEGFTRHGRFASANQTDFFTEAQAREVIALSLATPGVASAVGVVAIPASVIDRATSQTASESVTVFGVTRDFGRVWGPMHSRSGTTIDVASLTANQVYLGRALATRLNASIGDRLQVYVDGRPTDVTVSQVLNTDVSPPPPDFWSGLGTFIGRGLPASSLLMPVDSVLRTINRTDGSNLILLHNQGSGGVDDLGPGGATGREITWRMRAIFTDLQAAAELKTYLSAPAVTAQLKRIRDEASLWDTDKDHYKALVDELGRPGVSDNFRALAADQAVQLMMFQAVDALVPQQASMVERRAAYQDLIDRLVSLQVDSSAAAEMKALLNTPEVHDPLTRIATGLPPTDPLSTAIYTLLAAAQGPELTPKFKAAAGDPDRQQMLAATIGTAAPEHLARFNQIASRMDLYVFSPYKADAVSLAQVSGIGASVMLLSVSLFSMVVGALLIFLIFVMLAAERRAEMGMSRALGLRRRDLIQCFLFEGTAYTLLASVLGVALGVLVGQLMTLVISRMFITLSRAVELQYQVEWTSLASAMCLGILLTFVVVAVSAYKVSRLNIVTAIRDLNEGSATDAGLARMFTGIFGTAWSGVRQLLLGHPLVFLSRITLGTLGAIRTFLWALFRRGPLTIALGTLLVVVAVGQAPTVTTGDVNTTTHVEFAYGVGVSLVIIGAGLLIKWIFTLAGVPPVLAARIGFTLAALGLLLYWGRPFGPVEKLLGVEDAVQLSKLSGGPDMFVLTALMLLLGAMWLVMYNIEVVIRGVMAVTSRIGTLAPVTRTSMAYPMAAKFRTGMAVTMFALVTFIIVFMSVLKDAVTQTYGTDVATGGWQIVAGSPINAAPGGLPGFMNDPGTVLPADMAGIVRADKTLSSEVRTVGWEDMVPVQTGEAGATLFANLHVVDDGYLSNTRIPIKARAAGYASSRAVWDAVRDNVGFAIVDSEPSHPSFEPFQLQLYWPNLQGEATQKSMTVTVVGYAPQDLWGGVYMSTRTALAGGFFVPATPKGTRTSSGPATSQPTLNPSGYYFTLQPGVNPNQARLDLGRLLVSYALEPIVAADWLNVQVGAAAALVTLVTGFLALGLIVGIAGLGVVSTRVVVERWQQIGMLRAMGYRSSLVHRSFLMESSLIAILGLAIGAAVGVWQCYVFAKQFGSIVQFHVPVTEIAAILVVAYLATLVTTYLPARTASRIAPAAALRHE